MAYVSDAVITILDNKYHLWMRRGCVIVELYVTGSTALDEIYLEIVDLVRKLLRELPDDYVERHGEYGPAKLHNIVISERSHEEMVAMLTGYRILDSRA